MFSIKIDGFEIGELLKITNVNRGGIAPVENTFKQYSGINGSRLISSRYAQLPITIDFSCYGEIDEKWELVKRALTKNRFFKVVFGDFPDRFYNCVLDGNSTFDKQNGKFATGTISLVAPYPFAIATVETQAVRKANKLEFDNQGTARAFPIIEFTANQDYKIFGFTHPDGDIIQFGYGSRTAPIIKAGQRFVYNGQENRATIDGKIVYISEGRGFTLAPSTKTEIGLTFPDALNQVVTGKLRGEFV